MVNSGGYATAATALHTSAKRSSLKQQTSNAEEIVVASIAANEFDARKYAHQRQASVDVPSSTISRQPSATPHSRRTQSVNESILQNRLQSQDSLTSTGSGGGGGLFRPLQPRHRRASSSLGGQSPLTRRQSAPPLERSQRRVSFADEYPVSRLAHAPGSGSFDASDISYEDQQEVHRLARSSSDAMERCSKRGGVGPSAGFQVCCFREGGMCFGMWAMLFCLLLFSALIPPS